MLYMYIAYFMHISLSVCIFMNIALCLHEREKNNQLKVWVVCLFTFIHLADSLIQATSNKTGQS